MNQLSLNIHLQNAFSFESFYSDEANQELVDLLASTDSVNYAQLLIWGESGSGKSHLLQAYCNQLRNLRQSYFYLPLKRYASQGEKVLVGTSIYHALVIDDVDLVLGDQAWEKLLYSLINDRRNAGQIILMSASRAPAQFQCVYQDLQSRLSWGIQYLLHPITEEHQLMMGFRVLAQRRGIELNDAVIEFIRKRYLLSMPCLKKMLDYLDRQSMQDGRKITRHFVQHALADFDCESDV